MCSTWCRSGHDIRVQEQLAPDWEVAPLRCPDGHPEGHRGKAGCPLHAETRKAYAHLHMGAFQFQRSLLVQQDTPREAEGGQLWLIKLFRLGDDVVHSVAHTP